jgi:hypothetical protein
VKKWRAGGGHRFEENWSPPDGSALAWWMKFSRSVRSARLPPFVRGGRGGEVELSWCDDCERGWAKIRSKEIPNEPQRNTDEQRMTGGHIEN